MKIDILHIVDGRMGGEPVAALGMHQCALNDGINSRLVIFYPGDESSKFKVSKGVGKSIRIQLNYSRITNLTGIYFILKRLISYSSLVHIHGIWPIFSIIGLIVCKKNNKKFYISPHGSLENWSLNHKKYKKKFGILVLGNFFKRANSFFVTSIEESESVEKIVGNSVNVVKHALGVELRNITRDLSTYENKNILFVSRLSPKKGVDILIKSFINTGEKDWQLTIVGPSEDLYFNGLKQLVVAKNYAENINFLGPLQKNELNELYKTASFFALPSHSENFGFVIAEALAMKLPVLTTTGTPWGEINEYSCGYCIENGDNNFENYMRKMMHYSSGELKTMGENGYKLIKNSYTWNSASKNILNKYNEALIALKKESKS